MIRVLVIGANGFLGRSLTLACIRKGWLTDASDRQRPAEEPEGLNRFYLPDELTPQPYQYVFNVAAFIPYGAYDRPDEALIRSNVQLPADLLRLYPYARMIYASSVSVYGNAAGVITETTAPVQPTLYGFSKLGGEYITCQHTSHAVLRFSSLYGKGMFAGTFLPRIIADAISRKAITLYGDGSRRQNYLHVSDAAGYCLAAATATVSGIYLGVDTRSWSNREAAETVREQVPGCTITYTGEDKSPSLVTDNHFTVEQLGFTPVTTLADGIREMLI